jgi:hypothetical protein
MELDVNQRAIINETMKKWRGYTKPSMGILQNNPFDDFGMSFEKYAMEIFDGILIQNDYISTFELIDVEECEEEILRRVRRYIEKHEKTFNGLLDELGIKR